MHKPLELPWRVRLWHFIRGLLFYNTVYWKRASDDLNPPSLSREERLSHQPLRNLEIIRPRENPRAKLSAARGGQVSLPVVGAAGTPLDAEEFEAVVSDPLPATPMEQPPSEVVDSEALGPEVIIKRRRYRRRSNKVRPSQFGNDPTIYAKASYFGWLFTGKKRH